MTDIFYLETAAQKTIAQSRETCLARCCLSSSASAASVEHTNKKVSPIARSALIGHVSSPIFLCCSLHFLLHFTRKLQEEVPTFCYATRRNGITYVHQRHQHYIDIRKTSITQLLSNCACCIMQFSNSTRSSL